MAKRTKEEMPAFVKALCEHYKVPDIGALTKLPAYAKAFAETKDPMEAAEVMNRVKTPGGSIDGWFVRAVRVETFDKNKREWKDEGAGVDVLLPNGRTRTFPYEGDTSGFRPLATTVKVAGVTLLEKVYEKTHDWTGIDKATLKFEKHTSPMPNTDIAWLFRTGAAKGEKAGAIMQIQKDGCIRGDSGDTPVFGIYTVRGEAEKDVTFSDGRFDKERRPAVQAVVVDSVGTAVKARFRNVEELMRRHGLDESARWEDWQEALAGRRVAICGKVGAFHPRSAIDFESPGTPKDQWRVLADKVAELEAAGCIEQVTPKKGEAFRKLNLAKLPVQISEDGAEFRPVYVNIGKHKVYQLKENTKTREWEASVLATDAGGYPWLSGNEGKPPEAEGGYQFNTGAFVVWLDDLPGQKVIDETNPFTQAARQAGLELFG